MGGFDDDPGVRPAFHQFTAYAPAWAPVPDDGLPRFEERVDYPSSATQRLATGALGRVYRRPIRSSARSGGIRSMAAEIERNSP